MQVGRICHESASAAALEARRRRIGAWAAEMPDVGEQSARELAAIWDQTVELAPYLTSEEQAAAAAEIRRHLGGHDPGSPDELCARLPVFPRAASQVIQLAREAEPAFEQLEQAARSDPVLAGSVVAAANSSLFGLRQPIADISRAIAYLGSETTRNVLLAAAMRTVFGGSRHRSIWEHSIATAQATEHLARECRLVPGAEAFLSGLVHDIGRIALVLAPQQVLDKAERLLAAGCPLPAVEGALFGVEHTSLGAAVLRRWRFGQDMQDAARFHHEPEHGRSVHAALIYVAAFRMDSRHDLPSLARLKAACATAGLTLDQAVGIGFDQSQVFAGLATLAP